MSQCYFWAIGPLQSIQPNGMWWKKSAAGTEDYQGHQQQLQFWGSRATNDLENDLWHTHLITRTRRVDPGQKALARTGLLMTIVLPICSRCCCCGCGKSVFVSNIIGDINDVRHQLGGASWVPVPLCSIYTPYHYPSLFPSPFPRLHRINRHQ